LEHACPDFVDTSGFYALLVSKDNHFQQAGFRVLLKE